MSSDHLITGATGNIGGRVVEHLLEAGIRPKVLARDPEKVRRAFGERVDVRVGDLSDPASLRAAFAGISSVFLVTTGPDLAVRDAAAAQAAKQSGVRHLVKLSSLDVDSEVGAGAWHAQGERAVRESGLAATFVRPSGFMTNALWWAHSIRAEGLVRTSTGDGRIALIHPEDIAGVVTRALLEPERRGQVLSITGPAALTYAEMAATIGAAIRRPVGFSAFSDEEARRRFAGRQEPDAMVEALVSIWRAIREGRLARVTAGVEQILGRPPISFESWARENAEAFQAAAPGP
ncbi:MAG TPA: SDR family oxidoreductase [Polyangia bacterium]